MPEDNTPRLDALEARMEAVEEVVATLVDPDDVRDDRNISPRMYRDHELEAQRLVEEHAGDDEPWTIEQARENFDNLLREQGDTA